MRDVGPISCLAIGPRACPVSGGGGGVGGVGGCDRDDHGDALDEGFGDAVVTGRGDESLTVWDVDSGRRLTSYVETPKRQRL
jgi:hypothetical protein